MSDIDDITPDPEDPMKVYADRPTGQRVRAFLSGRTSLGQELEFTYELNMPDNVEAHEDGARKLAHTAWHLIAGQVEPDIESYDIDGEVDEELAQATRDAVMKLVEKEQRQQAALQEFMTKLYEKRPPGMVPKWN